MADENFKKMLTSNNSICFQPRTTPTFSFRPTFTFNRIDNSLDNSSEGSTNLSSSVMLQFNQSDELNKKNSSSLFGTFNTSNTSQDTGWPSLKLQTKSFSVPNTTSNIFSLNKNAFETATDTKTELQNTSVLASNHGQKTEISTVKPETFSFVREYKNTTIQEMQCKKEQMEEKPEVKESHDYLRENIKRSISKYKIFPVKFESSKQGGRLFNRALAGVKSPERKADVKTSERKTNVEMHKRIVFQSENEKKHVQVDSLSEDRRIASHEEIKKITSIVCKGIPKELNNKDFLSNHFSQYGQVKKINCNHKKEYAVVRFCDHESAANAKKNGALISPQIGSVEIFWAQQSSPKKQIGRMDSNSEVTEELHSMMEGIEDHKVLQRPEDMDSQKKPEFIIQKQTRKNLTNIEKSGNIKPQIETSEEMLWTLMTSTATTIGERYRILKARDKLLRLRQQKTSDIRKAKAIVGVCPDMCPEKERYNRAEKNCLSIFETSADKLIDHRAVIKEYSRSSADQEEPLPHELRPPDVLIKTMDYLLCNIVDLVNNDQSPGFSIGEWYDFIWNRTRAIRKDITQQHLCGLKSVSLVEKCARFHIHCSAVLCEEDMATFDAKINNENLTKCLQTLKHLYHDLNIQNIQCPQESEFRAYDVLLNINESDILREIQQFPSYIRESEEIKFAISIFNAVNSNNYIKFFRLVRKTTYLNACLLHRYFSQVRIKALHTILKAFCIPNRPEQFPMLELKHILAFESVNDVKEFCQWLGLKSDEKFVILNRSDFVLPTSPLPVSRAYQLIESKRVTNISEVINRGPLLENPYIGYEPHDSFDEQGKLKEEAYEALDQVAKCQNMETSYISILRAQAGKLSDHDFITTVTSENSNIFERRVAVPEKLEFSTVTDELLQDIVMELITNETNKMIQNDVRWETFLEKSSEEIFSALLESLLLIFLSEICIEVFTTEKEEKQLLFEAKEIERKTIEVECLHLTEEVVVEEAEKISRNIYMDIKTKCLEIIGQNLYHDIISEILTSEIFDIANEIHYKEMEIKRNMLKAIQEEMKLIRIRKVLDRWKQLCVKRRQLDEARKTFPSAPPLEMKNYKTPNGKRDALNFSKHLQKQCVLDLTVKDQLKNTIFSEPLDLKNILWNSLFLKYETFLESYTFKLLLILPMETDDQSYLWKKWFTEKFKKDCNENSILKSGVQTVSLYTAEIERNQNMLICIKSIDSKLQDLSIYQELLGTNAFIFVIGYWESSMQEFQDKLEEEGQRLIEYINYRLVYPPVPVYIFVVNNHSSKLTNEVTLIIENSLDLPYLKSNNLIFDWKISLLNGVGKPNNDFQLLQSVKWLAENTQIIPYLTAAYLKDFLEDGITKFVFNLVYSDLGERHKHCIYHQCPRAIIALYTAAISHMIDVTCSSYLEQLSWPMPEIAMIQKDKEHPPVYWNSSEQLRKVEKIIRNIQLKEYPENLSTEHKDDVWQYVDLIIADSRNKSLILKSNIHHLLSRSKNLDGEEVIPWADILQMCSFFLLDNIDFVDKETNREWMIYYLKDKFEQFYPPEKWNDMVDKSFWLPAIDTSVRKRKHSLEEKESKEIKLSSSSTSSSLLSQVFDETVRDLNKELESERETSRSFTQLLKKLADEEIVDQEVPTLDIIKSPLINHPANNTNISEMIKTREEFTLCQEDSLETKLKQLQMKLESERKANKLFKTKLLLIKQEDSFV